MAEYDQADLFLIPLLDGAFGVGQVVEVGPYPLCALSVRRQDRDAPAYPLAASEIAALHPIDPAHLTDGTWPVIGFEQIPRIGSGTAQDRLDPAVVEAFVNACHGLFPWDGFPDPAYFDGLLRPGLPRPAAARTRGHMA